MNDRYRPVRLLGGGGMAEVFLAIARGEAGFEKPVAIKRMLPHLARDEQVAAMFVDEARLSMHLQHQNIVQVMDVGRSPDGLFLVMELVNGWDLATVFNQCAKLQRGFTQVLAAYVAGQVNAGLAHAYRKRVNGKPAMVAHRDISPSNILFSVDGEVKVADFGIAKIETVARGTEPGTFKGKVPYSAPEVIQGDPVSQQSDQFSLGVVLYKMVLGRHPFGNSENLVAYAQLLARSGPPPMPSVHPALAEILQRMLAMEPGQRYASAEDLGAALARYLASAGSPASSAALAELLAGLELPPPPLDVPAPAAPPILLGTPAVRPGLDPGGFSPGELELGSWHAVGPVMKESGSLELASPHESAAAAQDLPSAAQLEPTLRRGRIVDGAIVDALPVSPAPGDPSLELLAVNPAAPPAEAPVSGLALADAGEQWRTRSAAPEEALLPEVPPPPSGAAWFARVVGRALLRGVLVVAIVGLAAAAGLYLAPRFGLPDYARHIPAISRLVHPPTAVLNIDSEPSGATISVDGTEIGETPLIQENLYPPRDISVRLSLRGYKPWTGTFRGGEEAHVEVKLKR